jgi:hypothetical protein
MASTSTVPTVTTHRPGWRDALRWVLRWTLRGLGALALLLVAVATAWVLSNLQDASPVPRPAALAQPTQQLSADRNAAFALTGLFAAEGKDPAQAGRALWAATQAQARRFASSGAAQMSVEQAQAEAQAQEPARRAQELQILGVQLAAAQVAPWTCDGSAADCVAVYQTQSTALVRQRQAMATLGARCEALVPAPLPGGTAGFSYEELLPELFDPNAMVLGAYQGALFCGRWFRTGAALALQQGSPQLALQLLARSHQLQEGVGAGSHTLVAQMVANRMGHHHLAAAANMAAHAPGLAASMAPLVPPLAAPEGAVRRWIAAEAASSQSFMAAVARNPVGTGDAHTGTTPNAQETWPSSWAIRAFSAASEWLMQHRISFHPERTLQLLDGRWLALLRQLDEGLPSAVARSGLNLTPGGDSALRWWRNPVGRILVEIGNGGYTSYLRRPLDLQLHQEAVALALQAHAQQVPAAARAAWAQQQPLSAELRARITWAADGSSLQVRSWAADALSAGQTLPERDRIHVLLQPAIP